MKFPSPFFMGTTTSSPWSKDPVQAVVTDSTRRRCSVQTKRWWSLRMRAPGSRWASVRTWKPLQMPSTGIPALAAATTSSMTGAKRAIAPQRR